MANHEAKKQTYDNLLKQLVEHQAATILPLLLDDPDLQIISEELLCFRVLLARARRLPEVQLARVLRRVRMFNPLLEDDPWIKEYGEKREAQGEVRGEARGKMEGEIKALCSILLSNLKRRFPALAETAEATAARITQPEVLNEMVEQVLLANDETSVRGILEAYSVS